MFILKLQCFAIRRVSKTNVCIFCALLKYLVCSLSYTICISIFISPWAHAELHAAIAQMETLLETHKSISDDLDDYILKEDKRLAILESYLEIYKAEHENMVNHIPSYLENPVNTFTLYKRLTTDLSGIKDFIQLGKEYIKNITLHHSDKKYPDYFDLVGAVQAITRLQQVYLIDVHDLAEGRIKGIKPSNPMTASDCFEVSQVLYELRDYQNTIAWSKETLRKYDEEASQVSFTKVEILEYMSMSHYLMGNVTTALRWNRKLLKMEPDHPRALHNLQIFQEAIKNKQKNETKEIQNAGQDTQVNKNKTNVIHNYGPLCRGEKKLSANIAKRLHCRYMTETHPFLRLAPFKVEQLYIGPDVSLFHDVISESEIEIIKNKTIPKLFGVNFQQTKSGKSVIATYRTSKSAWLEDTDSPTVARVTRRVAAMTGLSVASAEQLQVVNYGIGGHYAPHYDFFSNEFSINISNIHGNRFATVLIYMSDVDGGATVFPHLDLSVDPVKGAALFWINLLPSGEGDQRTLHGACPVLRGSKWVCTKWLRQAGQELLKPCIQGHQN